MRVVEVVVGVVAVGVAGAIGEVATTGVVETVPVLVGGLEPVVDVLLIVEAVGLIAGGATGVVVNHHCPLHWSTMLRLLKITRVQTYLEIGMITKKLSFLAIA